MVRRRSPIERHWATRRRGFTLIELMVALTGGLIFSLFVFMLTRDVSRFFRQEAGLSDASLAATTGYQRLRADVQRAGFLSSPNLAKDVGRCPAPVPGNLLANINSAAWIAQPLLQKLALARIEVGASRTANSTNTVLSGNALTPDHLYLYGNYTSGDQYPVRTHIAGAQIIYLDPNSEELARAGYPGAAPATILQTLFPVGQILRVVSADTGEEQYTLIASTAAATAATPTISISALLLLQAKGAGTTCGLRGLGGDLLVNTVNIARYELADLSADARFAFLFDGVGTNSQRLDFVRRPMNPDGTTNAAGPELVAEFAVDFKVSIQAVTNTTTKASTYYPEGATEIPSYAGDATAAAAVASARGPHLLRALRPRLAVRTRVPDRQGNIPAGPTGLFRVPLTSAGTAAAADFARVRTLQSFIMTRNTRNRVWN